MLSFKTIYLCASVCLLAACGFQPLYGSKGTTNVIADFSLIDVAQGKDRNGQLLTNELKHLLNPLKEPVRPKYRLVVQLTQSTRSLAIKKTALATRANLNAVVKYNLILNQTGELLTSGSNNIAVSYNIYSAEYATIAAEKDAANRAIKELAQDIRLQLGAYFKNFPQSVPVR